MSAGPPPGFSIVVPTRDRPEPLQRCLAALAALDFPKGDFEVVLVDDGSAVSQEPVASRARGALPLTFVRQARGGPAAARNTGALHARGSVLVFTDDDCAPEPGWLGAIARAVASRPGAMVGGPVVNGLGDDRFAAASQMLIAHLYDTYADGHPSRFFCTNNLAVGAGEFRELGGFDTSFPQPAAEDRELCERWLGRGHPMVFEPAAVVRHFHAMDFAGFLRQHFRYGAGAHRLSQIRRRRGDGGLRIEPPSFYTRMLRRPFQAGAPGQRWQMSALLAVSQIAGAAGFAWAKLRGGPVRLPAALPAPPPTPDGHRPRDPLAKECGSRGPGHSGGGRPGGRAG